MDMKKFLRIALVNLERVILGLLLLILIGVLVTQMLKHKRTRKHIERVREEHVRRGGEKVITALDDNDYGARVEVDKMRLWQPADTEGDWTQLAQDGNNVIFAAYMRHPPAKIASQEYRDYLRKTGMGTLFDPPLYVYPMDQQSYILEFRTVWAFYPPYNQDIPRQETTNGEDEPEIDVLPGKEIVLGKKEALIAWVRLDKTTVSKLPVVLLNVIRNNPQNKESWDIVVRVYTKNKPKGQIHFLRLGKKIEIPKTKYKIKDVEFEERLEGTLQIRTEIYTLVIVPKNGGPQIKLPKRRRVNDPAGNATYILAFFPYTTKRFRLKAGEKMKLRYKNRRETYRLMMNEDGRLMAQVIEGKDKGGLIHIKKYRKAEHRKWLAKHRKKADTPKKKVTPTGKRPEVIRGFPGPGAGPTRKGGMPPGYSPPKRP